MSRLRRLVFSLGVIVLLFPAAVAAQQSSSFNAMSLATSGSQTSAVLDRPATLMVREAPLEDALDWLGHSAKITVAFSPSDIARERRMVTCHCNAVTVREALDRLLLSTPFDYMEVRGQVVVYSSSSWRKAPISLSIPAGLASLGKEASASTRPRVAAPVVEGTIVGRVVEASTRRPLSGVQVFIPATGQGTLTNAEGNFTLLDVPDGQVSLRAQLIGYRTAGEVVSVQPGASVSVEFQLQTEALALDEIVVTGTAGQVSRRQQPAVVGTIDASERLEDGAVAGGVAGMLTAQMPGVQVTSSGGSSGTGHQIRIRGASSISLSNEPLVFINGIRADSRNQEALNVGGQGMSRLADINPEDIASIEVVKGPAAATLYGADASAGVIQIITKQGSVGSAGYSQTISLEGNVLDPVWDVPDNYAACGEQHVQPGSGSLLCQGQPVGTIIRDNPLLRSNSLEAGHMTTVNYSGRGGGDNFGYYLSGSHTQEQGVVPNNRLGRQTGRANFTFAPSSKLNAIADIGIYNTFNKLPIMNNNNYGYVGNTVLGTPLTVHQTEEGEIRGGWYRFTGEREALMNIRNELQTLRFTPSMQLTYRPTDWFINRISVGADAAWSSGLQMYPKNDFEWYTGDTNDGTVTEVRTSFENYTIDYLGSIQRDLIGNISSTLSFGLQGILESNDRLNAQGRGFVVNSNRVVDAATQVTAGQQYTETRSLGYLSQLDFNFDERLFLQLGARVDQNSSFGEEVEPFFLPKAGISYVISEESFWSPLSQVVSTMRLRAAWGTTGRSPSPGAALQTFEPRPYLPFGSTATEPGVIPLNPGNQELRPERGEEIEVGFDAGLLNERLGTELTFFRKTTTDLLLQRPVPPSSGFIQGSASNPFANIGEVLNHGLELSIRGRVVERPGFSVDAWVTGSLLHNELIDLGGQLPFGVGTSNMQRFREGTQLGAFFTRTVLSVHPEEGYAVVSDSLEYVGNSLPTNVGNVGMTFSLSNSLELSGQLDWKRNFSVYNQTEQFRDRVWRVSELAADPTSVSEEERIRHYGEFVSESGDPVSYTQVNGEYIEPGDFARLREVSLRVSLPAAIATRFGVDAASLTLGGNNVLLWTGYSGSDPEVLAGATTSSGTGSFIRTEAFSFPPIRRWMARVNFQF